MLGLLLFVLSGATRALAQTSYGNPAFTYWGCASVDPTRFSSPITFPNGGLTPEACQTACTGQMFAAVSPDACRCGNDPSAILSLNETACNFPCPGDPNGATCGGSCPDEGPDISNVFTTDTEMQSSASVPPADPVPEPPVSAIPTSSSTTVPPVSTLFPQETTTLVPAPSVSQTPANGTGPGGMASKDDPPQLTVVPADPTPTQMFPKVVPISEAGQFGATTFVSIAVMFLYSIVLV